MPKLSFVKNRKKIKVAVFILSLALMVQGGSFVLEAFDLTLERQDREAELYLVLGVIVLAIASICQAMSLHSEDMNTTPTSESSYQAVNHV